MATADVLANRERWAVECGDALEWLRSLPDDSVDLLFTSPPYEKARTYGLGERMVGGEAWVKWMFDVVSAAAPKVRGLIAVNCEGQTRNYRYSCVPFLLVADLHRAGFDLRKPCVFHRIGIPGSGGPDWLRNDWEPVVCVTRAGKLPWSEPTACGRPPKCAPGGRMSNRAKDGRRVSYTLPSNMRATGTGKQRQQGKELAARLEKGYAFPEIANPGNVVHCHAGGKNMGHDLAHENEAPFPLKLAEFFVRSFCPPGGVVCDPFAGSGTTCHAAVMHGRRFVGCDLRDSQVSLVARRMATVTPELFSGVV